MPPRRDRDRRDALKRAIQRGAYGSMLAMLYRRDIQIERAIRGIITGAHVAFGRVIEAPLQIAISSILAGRAGPPPERSLATQDDELLGIAAFTATTAERRQRERRRAQLEREIDELSGVAATIGTLSERRRRDAARAQMERELEDLSGVAATLATVAERRRQREARRQEEIEELAGLASGVGPAQRRAAERAAAAARLPTPTIPPPPLRVPPALGPAMQQVINAGGPVVMEEIRKQLDELAEQEAAFAAKSAVRAYGKEALAPVALADVDTKGGPEPPGTEMFPQAARQDAQRIVEQAKKTPVFGKMAEEVFQKQLGGLKDKVEAQIGQALQRGASTDDIIRMLRGTKAKKYADGLLGGWSSHNVKAFVRTVATAVSANAREGSFAALGVPYVQLIATLDLRTTDICISIDQTVWPVGEGPRPPLHPNCRTTVAPWWTEDEPKSVGGTRASMDGPVPASQTARDWFLTRPKDEQDDILGKDRAQAIRDGLPWEKLFGPGLKPLNLSDLRQQGLIPKAPAPELTPPRIPAPPTPPPEPPPIPPPEPPQRIASSPSAAPPAAPPDDAALIKELRDELKRDPTPAELVRERNRVGRQPTPPVRPGAKTLSAQHLFSDDDIPLMKEWQPGLPVPNFSPARQQMHDDIRADQLRGVPSQESPTLWMMGGGPASGKSSIVRAGFVTHPDPADRVMANADESKADLPEYRSRALAGDTGAAAFAHDESSYLNRRAMAEAARRKMHVVWDGTGDHDADDLKKQLDVFRAQGYKVRADYSTIPTEEAIRREAKRAEDLRLEGKPVRKVPEHIVRNTHARVSSTWRDAVKRGMFDEANLYDNMVPRGSPPVLIARARGTKLEILDEAKYRAFLAKADEVIDVAPAPATRAATTPPAPAPAVTPAPTEVATTPQQRRAQRQPTVPVNPGGRDTLEQHTMNGDGVTWSPQRREMHEEILNDAMRGVPKAEQPKLWLMGGGPASGKSSVVRSGFVKQPKAEDRVMANADDMKEEIPEFRIGGLAGDTTVAAKAHEESSYLNKELMRRSAERGLHVVWDGTGDHSAEKLKKQLDVFRARGYRIQADYVTIPTEVALQREAKRAADLKLQGKPVRKVPEHIVRDTHARVSSTWRDAVKMGLFDEASLYDNSGVTPVLIARVRGTSIDIIDETRYSSFLAKANEGINL